MTGELMCTAIIWWRKVCLIVVCMESGSSQIQSHNTITAHTHTVAM